MMRQRRLSKTFFETVTVVDLSPEIRRAAITLRRTRRLKLPDAIIAATAQILSAVLLTNDEDLLHVEGVPAAPAPLRP